MNAVRHRINWLAGDCAVVASDDGMRHPPDGRFQFPMPSSCPRKDRPVVSRSTSTPNFSRFAIRWSWLWWATLKRPFPLSSLLEQKGDRSWQEGMKPTWCAGGS